MGDTALDAPLVLMPVIESADRTLDAAVAGLAIALVFIPAAYAFLAWRRGRISRTSGTRIIVVALALATVGTFASRAVTSWDPLAAVGPFAPGAGLALAGSDGYAAVDNNPSDTTFTAPRYSVGVGPGQEFKFSMTLRNGSAVPLTIRGLLALAESQVGEAHYRIVAVERNPPGGSEQAVPLASGETVAITLVGRVEMCAAADGGSGQAGAAAADVLVALRFNVDVGGLGGVANVWPPFEIEPPAIPPCS